MMQYAIDQFQVLGSAMRNLKDVWLCLQLIAFIVAPTGVGVLHGQTISTQTLPWTTPDPALLFQAVGLSAQVIGNGALAPSGTVTFAGAAGTIGIATVQSVTNTNYLSYSSQFNNAPWYPQDANSVLTPNYANSPLGDHTAYRYQNVGTQVGTDIEQLDPGLPGNTPATFSVWVQSNTSDVQDLWIGIYDAVNGHETDSPCYATAAWVRCSVTTPNNTSSVQVYIGSSNTQWQWDLNIWGAQVDAAMASGPYIPSAAGPATSTLGLATIATSDLNVGSNNINATYSGDMQYSGSVASSTPVISSLQIIASCLEFPVPCETVMLINARVGQSYSASINAVGGTPPYTWTLNTGASTLPTGLTLGSSTGLISGTPTGLGNSNGIFDVLVSDSSTPPRKVARSFKITFAGLNCPMNRSSRSSSNPCSIVPPVLGNAYPNQVALGTTNQSVTLYGCIEGDGGNFGTVNFNLPVNVTQVGAVTVTNIPGVGQKATGMIDVGKNASLGTVANPPQIGINQVLDSCNQNSNTVAYYLTQYCAPSITVGAGAQEFPFINSYLWNQGDRTGVGAYFAMQANPSSGDWDNAPFFENVNPLSNSCPASAQPGHNICYFPPGANGYFGDVIPLVIDPAQTTTATHNVAWDQHTYPRGPNVLAGAVRSSCTATCRQWYYCGNSVEGTYTVTYTLNEVTSGTPYTLVNATKH